MRSDHYVPLLHAWWKVMPTKPQTAPYTVVQFFVKSQQAIRQSLGIRVRYPTLQVLFLHRQYLALLINCGSRIVNQLK